METVLHGIGVSPGIAVAPALVFAKSQCEVPEYSVGEPGTEWRRFQEAVEKTRVDLRSLHSQTAEKMGQRHADIFHTHLMLLDDAVLHDEIRGILFEEAKNVEHVLERVARRYAALMESVGDARLRERSADMMDVADRLQRCLLDQDRPDLKSLPGPRIVVSRDLSPSDTATMDTVNTLGLALDAGSVTSHSAILARALEIPAVTGLSQLSAHVRPGAMMVLDGAAGVVILDPSEETLGRYRAERERFAARRERQLRAAASGPAVTLDGVGVPLEANIELPVEIPHSLRAGACGIGLYRTEYLFLNRDEAPGEEEQYQAYAEAARALSPMPVTLRTMDIGGDKLVAHLQIFKEENPQLGWRAVRFCLARPDIFKVQLRAMLRAAAHGGIRIMFPMISGLDELREVRRVLDVVREELDREGVPHGGDLPVGSMIEVPSAVMLADVLAKECDFFSIGTNDLIQYSLAVDRVNEKIAHLYDPAHPAVLRLIGRAAAAARDAGIPCGICGEMAGDPLFTEILLGLGVTSLSMAAVALPAVRTEITGIRMDAARELAGEALQMGSAADIRGLLQTRFDARNSAGNGSHGHDGNGRDAGERP